MAMTHVLAHIKVQYRRYDMIPGPYAICHVTFEDNSGSAIYRTLKYGYDTAMEAYSALSSVASEFGVAESECAVIRHIDYEKAGEFNS